MTFFYASSETMKIKTGAHPGKQEKKREENGTPGWDRTSGFQLRRLTLYPLSYGRGIKKSYKGLGEVSQEQINGFPYS